MSLLIINPNDSENYKGLSELRAIEPPVWAAMIAHELRRAGYDVHITDANALEMSPGEIGKNVKFINPDAVLITCCGHNPTASTTVMPAANAISREIRRAHTCKIAMFGIHPTALPGKTLKESYADEIFPQIVNKNLTAEMQGLAWDLLRMDKYRAHNWHCFNRERIPYAALYTSLGCPYSCDFCPIHTLLSGKRYATWRPRWVIEQIDILVEKYKVSNIRFADELFLINGKRVEKICDLIINRGYDLNIWAYGRVDYCPPKLLEKMKRAGINWICLGIESEDAERKGYRKGDPGTAVRKFKDAGINVIGNYMFGFPDDDLKSMQATLDLAMGLNCEFANFYCLVPYPGSQLYRDAPKQDLPDSWGAYAQLSPDFKPLKTKHLSSLEVLQFRDKAFEKYFSNERYLNMMENKFGKEVRNEVSQLKSPQRSLAP